MTTKTTYTSARANFKRICDQVISTREAVVIHRGHGEDVALISADELDSLMETAHLLRSPANTERLQCALARAQKGRGKCASTASLRKQIGMVE